MCTGVQETSQIAGLSIDNLIVLSAAIIGVFGSLLVYLYRNHVRRRRLRRSLLEEMRVMYPLVNNEARILEAEVIDEDPYIPMNPVIDTVFSNNAGDVGLLTEQEVKGIVSTYSIAFAVSKQLDEVLDDTQNEAAARKLRSKMINLNNNLISSIKTLEEKLDISEANGGKYSRLEDPGLDVEKYMRENEQE